MGRNREGALMHAIPRLVRLIALDGETPVAAGAIANDLEATVAARDASPPR